jgi:hypothetical protein
MSGGGTNADRESNLFYNCDCDCDLASPSIHLRMLEALLGALLGACSKACFSLSGATHAAGSTFSTLFFLYGPAKIVPWQAAEKLAVVPAPDF